MPDPPLPSRTVCPVAHINGLRNGEIMRAILTVLVSATTLAACASPQDRCMRQAQAELYALDAQILDAEQALARGYRVTAASEARTTLHICAWPKEPVLFCTRHTPATSAARVAVDRDVEQENLDRLRRSRAAVAAQSIARVAQCSGA